MLRRFRRRTNRCCLHHEGFCLFGSRSDHTLELLGLAAIRVTIAQDKTASEISISRNGIPHTQPTQHERLSPE
jgi:hypothetical protein